MTDPGCEGPTQIDWSGGGPSEAGPQGNSQGPGAGKAQTRSENPPGPESRLRSGCLKCAAGDEPEEARKATKGIAGIARRTREGVWTLFPEQWGHWKG